MGEEDTLVVPTSASMPYFSMTARKLSVLKPTPSVGSPRHLSQASLNISLSLSLSLVWAFEITLTPFINGILMVRDLRLLRVGVVVVLMCCFLDSLVVEIEGHLRPPTCCAKDAIFFFFIDHSVCECVCVLESGELFGLVITP